MPGWRERVLTGRIFPRHCENTTYWGGGVDGKERQTVWKPVCRHVERRTPYFGGAESKDPLLWFCEGPVSPKVAAEVP